jgi:hypothetical protein
MHVMRAKNIMRFLKGGQNIIFIKCYYNNQFFESLTNLDTF